MLAFDGVTKRFGSLVALEGCTFTARPGRLTGFLGPNGATATTDLTSHRVLITVLTGDVILVIIAGAGFPAVAIQMVNLWTGHRSRPIAHH